MWAGVNSVQLRIFITAAAGSHFETAAGLWALLVFRIALRLGEGPLNLAAFAIIGQWVPAARRAEATSIYASASLMGTVLALVGVAWLTSRFGWRSAFYLCGALGLV